MSEHRKFSKYIEKLDIHEKILIVFDLDYTLWDFWIDTHVRPPFSKNNGVVVDSNGAKVHFYPDSHFILEVLSSHPYIEVAVASRTTEIEGARNLLQVSQWDSFIKYKEIYPGSKMTHLAKLNRASGVTFNRIIFFDDEERNIRDVSKMGVHCVHVNNGINVTLVQNYLIDFLKGFR